LAFTGQEAYSPSAARMLPYERRARLYSADHSVAASCLLREVHRCQFSDLSERRLTPGNRKVIQNDAQRQLHARAEQAVIPTGGILLRCIALPDMIDAELARPTPRRAPSLQRPIPACSEADLHPEVEAAVAEGFGQQGERTADREFHRAADEAATRAFAGRDHMMRTYLRGRHTGF
jgi:hypothetical protein